MQTEDDDYDDRWGRKYAQRGWIAEEGKAKYIHRFGGNRWRSSGPLDSELGPPALIVTLDLRDPRLAELRGKSRATELPLLSYLNANLQAPQKYLLDHAKQKVQYSGKMAKMYGDPLEEDYRIPVPLKERRLALRDMLDSELPVNSQNYESACDSFFSGPGTIRILGAPLWLDQIDRPKSSDKKLMRYVAAVGPSPLSKGLGTKTDSDLFFGELAMFFFVSADVSELTVTWHSGW